MNVRRKGTVGIAGLSLMASMLGLSQNAQTRSPRQAVQAITNLGQIQVRDPAARLQQVFDLSADFGDREILRFDVSAPGRITGVASWKGSATRLALVLNGPGQVGTYARQDGVSPLRLEFDVTKEILALGREWRLSIINFDRGSRAAGRVVVTHPVRSLTLAELSAPMRGIIGRAKAAPAVPLASPERSILPDGQVQVRYPDGTIEILHANCGSTKIFPDGTTIQSMCNQVQTAALPPTPTDAGVRAFLEHHRDQLLRQISRLVNDNPAEISLYLNFESSTTNSLYGQIKLRTELMDKLLP